MWRDRKKMEEPVWITGQQASEIIGCHILTVYRFSRIGWLKRKKDPERKIALFLESDAKNLKITRAEAIRVKAERRKETGYKKGKKRIEAICPRCKKVHMSSREWTGTGRPYFFCQKCQKTEAYGMASPWQNMAVI
jgi:undecaprenyl pyrophosphate synthase